MTEQLIEALLGTGGPYAVLVAFMVWDRWGQNKLAKERIEADLKVATALTLLSARIDHVR